jgi:hypothetical protein
MRSKRDIARESCRDVIIRKSFLGHFLENMMRDESSHDAAYLGGKSSHDQSRNLPTPHCQQRVSLDSQSLSSSSPAERAISSTWSPPAPSALSAIIPAILWSATMCRARDIVYDVDMSTTLGDYSLACDDSQLTIKHGCLD